MASGSAVSGPYPGVVFGDFSFLEPETCSDQRRQVLIINTAGEGEGYYVDVFRSHRRDGKDKMHDYFYHNIGQEFSLNLATDPCRELAFGGGHLYAYSYIYDQEAVLSDEDVEGIFTMKYNEGWDAEPLEDGSEPELGAEMSTGMRFWMKGEKERKIFKALSPKTDAFTRTKMPYDFASAPTQTYVARQYGEAWNRPFAAVYEPYGAQSGGSIEAVEWFEENVGVCVKKKDGREDYIFCSDKIGEYRVGSIEAKASVAVASTDQVFMSNGYKISNGNLSISASEACTAAVWSVDGAWYYVSDAPVVIKIGRTKYKVQAASAAVKL